LTSKTEVIGGRDSEESGAKALGLSFEMVSQPGERLWLIEQKAPTADNACPSKRGSMLRASPPPYPPESDWKIFSQLRVLALDRLCKRILAEVNAVATEAGKSNHERFGNVYSVVMDRNKEIANAFDYLSRSRMISHLVAMRELRLVTDEEMRRFSEDTRKKVEALSQIDN
jgi:hypothetical protein